MFTNQFWLSMTDIFSRWFLELVSLTLFLFVFGAPFRFYDGSLPLEVATANLTRFLTWIKRHSFIYKMITIRFSICRPPVPRFRCTDIQTIINSLHSKKSSGYDLITVLILKSLPPIGIKYLTQLFNPALFLGYFPDHWKVAQIILV
jgi:hypothetical protein